MKLSKIFGLIKRVFSAKPKDSNLFYVFTDRFGNNYYAYKDVRKMPYSRAIHAASCVRFAEMNLTYETLKKLVSIMLQAQRDGKDDLVSMYLHEIDNRLEYAGEEVTLLNLAASYFVIEGENPKDLDTFYLDKKIELWKKDSIAKSFFLQRAYELTSNYGSMSVSNIQDYLRNQIQTLNERNIFS